MTLPRPGQICVPVESSSPLVQSNQKEVLRCFTVLGKQGWNASSLEPRGPLAAAHGDPGWT